MIKLSVIIPAYNTAEYLKPLLDKLMKQKKNEVEIIVIDNGSTQDMKFIDDYDIIAVHKPYGYVSSARNMGLDIAKGKYIAFLDSDDDIPEYFIDRHLMNASSGCDYTVYRFSLGKHHDKRSHVQSQLLWSYNCWAWLFKKDYIGNKRFREDLEFEEDVYFLKDVVVGGKRKEDSISIVYYNDWRQGSNTDIWLEGLKNKGKK